MSAVKAKIPPLRNGDELPRDEFERRYERMPGVKAELIEGVVYTGSPVSTRHSEPHGDLGTLLGVFALMTPGVKLHPNATVRLAPRSEPQPDLTLLKLPSHGGRTNLSKKGYIVGAPELVVEISYSTASVDARGKSRAYLAAGVGEYILYRVEEAAIDWFRIVDGKYELMTADPDGLTRSHIFPGLALDLAALVRGDAPAALTRLQSELAARA